MENQHERTISLIGEDKFNILKDSCVFVAGLGGVGGYTAEALARAGVGKMIICDFDTVSLSNINRQILALHSTAGMKKTVVCAGRLTQINPDIKLTVINEALSPDNISGFISEECDAIADCIDDVDAKLGLVKLALSRKIYIISSMGTGNKLNPMGFSVCDISKTSMDRLARTMRKRLRAEGITKGVDVLFSAEEPIVQGSENGLSAIPSISYMPAVAGNIIAGRIINKLI